MAGEWNPEASGYGRVAIWENWVWDYVGWLIRFLRHFAMLAKCKLSMKLCPFGSMLSCPLASDTDEVPS